MSSDRKPASSRPPSPPTRPDITQTGEMLTPSELDSLAREMREAGEYCRRAFAHLPKVRPSKA